MSFGLLMSVNTGPGKMAGVERGDQGRGIDLRAASRMNERGASGQLREQPRIEKAARLLGERQQTNEDVGAAQHLIESVGPAESRDAVDLPRAPAPASEREAERPEPFERRLPQQAETKHADPSLAGLHRGKGVPFLAPLLFEISG